MIGGNSKFVPTGTHTHVPAHTHTQLTSQNGEKEIDFAKWRSGLGKRTYLVFSPGVDSNDDYLVISLSMVDNKY
jgi:hypothetical protein